MKSTQPSSLSLPPSSPSQSWWNLWLGIPSLQVSLYPASPTVYVNSFCTIESSKEFFGDKFSQSCNITFSVKMYCQIYCQKLAKFLREKNTFFREKCCHILTQFSILGAIFFFWPFFFQVGRFFFKKCGNNIKSCLGWLLMMSHGRNNSQKNQKKCDLKLDSNSSYPSPNLSIKVQVFLTRNIYIYIWLHIFNNFSACVMFCNRRLRAKFFMQIFNSGFQLWARQTAPFCRLHCSEAKMAG
jgi:hypothetical protein